MHASPRLPVIGSVLVVVSLTIAGCTTDDAPSGSGCIDDLVENLPAEVGYLDGADLEAAREAGYDDGTYEDAARTMAELGVWPDPVTLVVATSGRDQVDTSELPFDPSDVECWVGSNQDGWVARGDFDAERVEAFADMDLSVDDDSTLVANDPALLEPGDPDAAMVAAVETLAEDVLVSFSAVSRDDGTWIGLGLSAVDDGWEMAAVWSYPDEGAAEEAEDSVRDVLASDSRIGELVEAEPADQLERDGTVLVLRDGSAGEPSTWMDPLRYYDEIFGSVGTEE